jgi:hypothetical protein
MSSPCPPGKIRNPRTNRCVKKTGRIGKKLIPSKDKECDENKVVNPKTKRCVKKLSRIGRKLSPVYYNERSKNCASGKILNPRTKRCVKRDGRVGRRVEKGNHTPEPVLEESDDELEDVDEDFESLDYSDEEEEVDLSDLLDDDEEEVDLSDLLDDDEEEQQSVLQEETDDEEELEEEQTKSKEFESGSTEFYYYAMKYLNEKYDECFLKPLSTRGLEKNHETGLYEQDNEYELLWEDKPAKETVLKDSKNPNLKLYGNRYAYFVDKKHRKIKEIDGLLYVNKKVTEKIMKCMKGKSRFIILTLNITKLYEQDGKLGGTPHANILIYDKKNSTLERYEPHGPGHNFLQKKSSNLMDVDVIEYFTDIGLLKSKKDYYAPVDFCPKWDKWVEGRTGHQMLQNLESKEFVGSCATWCMWYVDDRLQNPDKPRDRIIQESIEDMQKSSKGFTKFIKKYYEIIKEYRDKK